MTPEGRVHFPVRVTKIKFRAALRYMVRDEERYYQFFVEAGQVPKLDEQMANQPTRYFVASAEELGDMKTFKIHADEPVPDQEWEG